MVGGATIVIIAEYKEPDPAIYERGLKLFTVHVRRGDPAVQDQKINSHSKLNCILASIQATQAGADEALMLDPHGFVATCNSTHFFIVRKGEVWTSSGKYCLGGITRGADARDRTRGRHPGDREGFLADRRLRRRRGVRDRHLRRIVPVREIDGRDARLPRADGRAAAETLRRAHRARHRRSRSGRDLIRIAMWSGPRNLSTAMMRSFGSRADTSSPTSPSTAASSRRAAPITRCAKR